MNKKRFYEEIKKTIEHERDVKRINLFNKMRIHNLIYSLQKELINSIDYKNSNNSVISIVKKVIMEDCDSIFGKTDLEREKCLDYFKQCCEELGIQVGLHNIKCNSQIFDSYLEIVAVIDNPSYKKTK